MAKGRNIKGITIEIGGDTTKLSKALSGTNKEIANTKSSLKDVERLLKLDPSNTELLAQKQKLLTSAVDGTKEKLDVLKTAAKQAEDQLRMGSITQSEFDDLQREIIDTTQELKRLEDQSKHSKSAVEKIADAKAGLQSAGEKISGAGGALTKGVTAPITAAATAAVGLAKGTEEMRVNIAKYTTAFETAGFSAKIAEKTYTDFYGILGDSDQSTEAIGNLAKLCDTEQDLSTWTDIATGVFATFGDGLPVEGLTEAANETAKVGQVTGTLADALNWAGVSEDKFNKKLEKCNGEQERAQLITDTLNGLYSDAAVKYNELNKSTEESRKNQAELSRTLAELGAEIQPIINQILQAALPAIKQAAQVVQGLLQKFQQLNPQTQKIILTISAIAAAIGPVLVAVGKVVWSIGTIMTIIPKLITAIKAVKTVFTALKVAMAANPIGLIVVAIGLLIAAFMHLWNTSESFRNFWIGMWNKIKTTVVNIGKSVAKTAGNMLTSVKNKVDGVYTAVKNGISKAVNYIKELPSKALNWGKDFIGGFIDGIQNKAKELTGKIGDLAESIASFLHFSRPDEGPLHYYEQWMPDFMRGLAAGIEQNRGLVTGAISGLASDMTLSPSVQMAAGNASTTELRGLRAEVRQLRGALASMQVVMDTGATVGALAPEMDNALGRISSRRGRGN